MRRTTRRHGFRRNFERKILRWRKFFENFGSKSRAISRAAACRRSAQCSGTSKGRGEAACRRAAGISARSRAISNKIFAAANFFRNFRSEIRSESGAISRAAACRRSAQMLGTSEAREHAFHHKAALISARSRAISNEKCCGRETFGQFRSEIRSESRAISRAAACGCLRQFLRTCENYGEAVHHQAARISA